MRTWRDIYELRFYPFSATEIESSELFAVSWMASGDIYIVHNTDAIYDIEQILLHIIHIHTQSPKPKPKPKRPTSKILTPNLLPAVLYLYTKTLYNIYNTKKTLV